MAVANKNIPITSIILEQLGFVMNQHLYPFPYYEYENKEKKFKIGYAFPNGSNKTKFKENWIEIDSETAYIGHMTCTNLDCFRHVLNLCGIDEEFKLDDINGFDGTIAKAWRSGNNCFEGYYINNISIIDYVEGEYNFSNHNVFATQKQAKSALAMAQISQIMANDKRFGGVVTDEEWNDSTLLKHVIGRQYREVCPASVNIIYHFLAFHTEEQRELFLKENKDLVRDYLMI